MSNYDHLKLNGAEVKIDKTGQLIVGFTSQKITNSQLSLLREVDEKCFLAFYGCDFSQCDLTMFNQIKVDKIGIIYSKFSDDDLLKIIDAGNLTWIKLFDTQVTENLVKEVLENNNNLQILLG